MAGSEEELLENAVVGDRDSLARLLEQHGPMVRRRLACRIPRRWRSVLSEDDVMQQTYADAALGIGRFEPRGDGAFAAWLAKLAECNLCDALRMLKAQKRGGTRRKVTAGGNDQSYIGLQELLATTSSTPSRHVSREEAQAALRTALGQLPAIYRRVLEMYDLAGRSVEEVAAELHRSRGAVYMLRARAHARLAELMGHPSKYFSDVP